MNSADKVLHSEIASVTDEMFAAAVRTWVTLQTRTGKSKGFLYYFDRVPPMPNSSRYGAYHGADLFYVFDAMNYHGDWAWGPADQKLSDTMIGYWVNFAKTGDPNGPGLPTWPVWNPRTQLAMQLGEKVGAIPLPCARRLDFWDDLFAQGPGEIK